MTTTPEIDALVRGFARFLAASHSEVSWFGSRVHTGSFYDDWAQANWEALVEAACLGDVYLEVYGEGADCNDSSSRVYLPHAIATHRVVCLPGTPDAAVVDLLSGEQVELSAVGVPLEEFVALDGTWFTRAPPFDSVLIELEGRQVVVRVEALRFDLSPLPAPSERR